MIPIPILSVSYARLLAMPDYGEHDKPDKKFVPLPRSSLHNSVTQIIPLHRGYVTSYINRSLGGDSGNPMHPEVRDMLILGRCASTWVCPSACVLRILTQIHLLANRSKTGNYYFMSFLTNE